jgi:hypothetical protein
MVQALRLTRREDWPERLAAFIEARRTRRFKWGEHDCALFAADWVLECCGVDLADCYRGTYRTAITGRRLVDAGGGLMMMVRRAGLLALPSPYEAHRGDIAQTANHGRTALGIVDGPQVVGPGEGGLVWHPIHDAIMAWRI